MYLQEILEVAIGLVFVWLIISVAAIQFQEWIAALLCWRSHDLETTIRNMLAGENAQANQIAGSLASELYNHPLITSLTKNPGWFEQTWVKIMNWFLRLFKKTEVVAGRPSYIPNSKFALALFDIVMNAGQNISPLGEAANQLQAAFDQAKRILNGLKNPEIQKDIGGILNRALRDARSLAGTPLGDNAVDSIKFEINTISIKYPYATAIPELLLPQIDLYYSQIVEAQRIAATNTNTDDEVMKRLRIGIIGLGAISPDLMKSLRSLVTGVEGYAAKEEKALATARKNVETWFDDTMDRLSGAYKRKAQMVAFILGFSTAILLNIDSINLATMLWREPTLRQAIVAEAQTYVNQNPSGPATGSTTGTLTYPADTFSNVRKQIENLTIPVGWFSTPVAYDPNVPCLASADTRYDPVTGIAISLTGIRINTMCYPIVNALPMNESNWIGWLTKLLGLLLTGAAAAQGAPFWFDILKRLVNLRSSGTNPSEDQAKG
jgi:hypothetical protein